MTYNNRDLHNIDNWDALDKQTEETHSHESNGIRC